MAAVSSGAASTVRSPGFKFLLIVILTVAMAVPLFLVRLALSDREQTAAGAASDIGAGWGGPQVVAGPILLVPYTVERQQLVNGQPANVQRNLTAMLLPENLNMDVRATSGTRWRGIFEVPVYKAAVQVRASFEKAAVAGLVPPDAKVHWDGARIAIRVSDAHGLADNVVLNLNGHKVPFESGVDVDESRVSGIQAAAGIVGPSDLALDTSLTLRGSREFSISPLGRRTTATVQSDWHSPSFFGPFLPTDRDVGKDGFKASWTVPYLARGFGQSFESAADQMDLLLQPAFGARFYQPIDHYQLVERSLKYAILFVALAFLVFFVVETVSPQRLHAVQYALVGSAQVLFYLLLLSLSEHIGFALSYLAASAATVVLTSLYASSVLASWTRAAALFVVLTVLYGLLYVILSAEDYALLIGSGLLFAALAATMYVTRKINWYTLASLPAG
jgi:inner membrane protein